MRLILLALLIVAAATASAFVYPRHGDQTSFIQVSMDHRADKVSIYVPDLDLYQKESTRFNTGRVHFQVDSAGAEPDYYPVIISYTKDGNTIKKGTWIYLG